MLGMGGGEGNVEQDKGNWELGREGGNLQTS